MTALRHHINNWHEMQTIYMPGVVQILKSQSSLSPTSTPTHPEHETLYLPSSISFKLQASSCVPGLPDTERCICKGQADDMLNEVRWQLCITSSIIQFKQGQHQASQQLSQKSRALMVKFKNKTDQAAERYIAAYTAFTALDPGGSWALRLQQLNMAKDLHLPRQEEDDGLDEEQEVQGKGTRFRGRKQSKNQRELSWIWGPSKVTSVDEVNESKLTSVHTTFLPLTDCAVSHASWVS